MSETLRSNLWLIPGLPLLSAAVIGFLGPCYLRRHSHWPCIVSIFASFVLSFLAFLGLHGASGEAHPLAIAVNYPWIQTAGVDIWLNLRVDALTSMMLVMVTFIAGFIAVYSVGYMDGDPGYPRFFAAVSLFVFSMTLLVMGDNFLVLFAGWEGVGLCSYLLIGFWFSKPSAAAAARKAFLVTRIGDVGLLLGILLLWNQYGSLDYQTVLSAVEEQTRQGTLNHRLMVAAALLLFCGAVGKSAQFPLHVWLPDAMEGPTPVSALIHAATMVTAGIYLVARCTPIFLAAPEAQLVVACIGGFTALMAALIALTQNDLKRILAYSTLSQLGYMFLALGCGLVQGDDRELVTFAVTAAMFHLFTHAFFKALLFMGAGSVMHSMGHVIDIRRLGGLRHKMPVTHATFLCGSLALAGFPLLSGFWSKDEILAACHRASHVPFAPKLYFLLLCSAFLTAGLTAFYTFRAYFKTFWGEVKIPEEALSHHGHHDHDHDSSHGHDHHHAHTPAHAHHHNGPGGHGHHAPAVHPPRTQFESPAVMTFPLMVLAVFAVLVGFVLGPTHLFAHWLEKTPGWPHMHEEPHLNFALMGISTIMALGGIALAWWMYVRQPELPAKVAKSAQALYQLSLNKFYIDEIYAAFIVRPAEGLANLLRRADTGGIDSMVDLTGNLPRMVGNLFRPIQNGLVQFYALAMVLGLTVFLLSLLYKM